VLSPITLRGSVSAPAISMVVWRSPVLLWLGGVYGDGTLAKASACLGVVLAPARLGVRRSGGAPRRGGSSSERRVRWTWTWDPTIPRVRPPEPPCRSPVVPGGGWGNWSGGGRTTTARKPTPKPLTDSSGERARPVRMEVIRVSSGPVVCPAAAGQGGGGGGGAPCRWGQCGGCVFLVIGGLVAQEPDCSPTEYRKVGPRRFPPMHRRTAGACERSTVVRPGAT
jgi:hypothetical protein